ncbi:MAG TPA: chemotaxis protein CheW [Chthonomonadaceae bacterium]|nr:chemotaxis protein CheW [Chthonomonadaceae bacterium]
MANNQIDTLNQEIGLSADANQFLTFTLGEEEYGVDILKVQEIKGYVPTTRIPNAPSDVTGVLNLRGTIVPIVDLRRKFNLDMTEYDQFTCIVVVVVQNRVMGMIVDSVSEVMNIPPSDIQPPPDFGNGFGSSMLRGMAKVGEKLIILLDIDTVLLGESAGMAYAA